MPNGPETQQYLFQKLGISPFSEDPIPPIELPADTLPEPEPAQEGYLFERLGLGSTETPTLTPTQEYNKELESQHNVPDAYKESSGFMGMVNDNALNKDISQSEWNMIKDLAKRGDPQGIAMREAVFEDYRRKMQFGEGAQYAAKRLLSIIPFVEADWQKHRLNPLQFAAASDPDSPDDIYDPSIRGFRIPGAQGLRLGMHDAADMASMIGEFGVIGMGTSLPFQAMMKAKKGGKLTSGIYRLMAKSPRWKRVITNVSKANIDFQLFNLATVHPEDTKEGATLKDKIRERVKNIPKTMLDATLFGSLGSFENVYAQYGGVFTAGYSTAILAGVMEGANPAEVHAEAMKGGFMLVGAHAANVLGTKGGEFFKKYGKGKGLTDKAIEFIASHIVEKRTPEKEIWRSKTKDLTKVQIVGEKKVRGKDSFVLQDIGNDKVKVTMEKNEFYENYDKTNRPKEADKIRTKRLGLVHKLQRQLGLSDKAIYDLKQKIFGQKGEVADVKSGELPFYIDLQSKTKVELEVIAKEYDLTYSEKATRQQLIDLIEKSVPKSAGEYISWADASPEQLYKGYHKLDNQLQVRNVKKDIKLGLHTEELTDKDGNKVYIKRTFFGKEPIASVTNAERIIKAYTGETKRGALIAEKMAQQMNELVHEHNLTEDNFRRIAQAKFGKKIDIKDLSPAEQELLDIYEKNMEQGAIFGLEEGIFDTIVENYMTGLYPEMSQNMMIRHLGRGKRITGETIYAKEKVHDSPVAAEEAGLKPIYDMRILVGKWWSAAHKAVAQQNMARRLMDLPAIDGNPALSAKKVSGYIAIKDMPLLSKMLTGSRNRPLYIHPQLEMQFKLLMKTTAPLTGWRKHARTLNNSVKRIIMINPLIHGWNIYSDVMDEYSFRLLKSGKVLLFGEKDWLLLKRAGMVKNKKEFKNLSREEQNNLIDRLEMEMAEAGIDLATTTSVTSDLQNAMGRTFAELTPSNATLKQRFQQLGGRISGAKGVWGKTKMIGRSLRLGSDTLLWDRWVRNSQVAIYTMIKSRAMKKGLTAESAKRVAGHYTKDLLGMLDKEVFSADGFFSGDNLNYMFFARNWTISNMRLVSGALGYRGSKLARFLSHRELNRGEMKFLQEQYAAHILKGTLGMIVMTNAVNYLITGTETEKDEQGKFKQFKFNKEKARWATDNEEGHELDLDSGMVDSRGRRIYITPPIFRYLRDYFGWYGEPMRTFFNKVHPLPKTMLELGLNMSLWNRRQIVSYPEQKTIGEKSTDVLKHAIYAMTPYSQFAGRPDEVRNWAEKIIPWFGTWIRHGVGGGDFAMDINKLLREKGYERDEIDKEIDLMAQEGDPIGVIQALVDSGRYRTADGIQRRLIKYQNPLLYKFLLLSKTDQAELLLQYTPNERKKFIESLRLGDSKVKIPNLD